MLTNLITAQLRLGLVEFNWTYVMTIVNAIIMFFIMKKFLFKPMQKFMNEREEAIKKQYSDAQTAEDKAKDFKEKYESKLADSEAEGEEIIRQYTDRAQLRASEIVGEAEQTAESMKAKAEKQIDSEVKKAVHVLRSELSELSIMAASRIMEKEITAGDHVTIVDKVIEEVGDVKWQN